MPELRTLQTPATVEPPPPKARGLRPTQVGLRCLAWSLLLISFTFGTTLAALADESRTQCVKAGKLIDAGNDLGAVPLIGKAIDAGGEVQLCYLHLARIFLNQGKAANAEEALNAVIQVQGPGAELPNEWWRLMAVVQMKLGELEQSLAYYTIALESDPSPSLYAERGMVYSMLRRYDKVARDLRSAGKLVPGDQSYEASAKTFDERHASKLFLDKMRAMDGATNTPMKVVYIVERSGTGPKPVSDSTVTVHYHGTLRDGTVIDSSIERGRPATMPLDKVIPCWSWALENVGVGSKLRVGCPPEQAYGWKGAGRIPPGAALHYEMELLAIE